MATVGPFTGPHNPPYLVERSGGISVRPFWPAFKTSNNLLNPPSFYSGPQPLPSMLTLSLQPHSAAQMCTLGVYSRCSTYVCGGCGSPPLPPLPPLRSLPRLPLPYRNSDAGIEQQLWNYFHEVNQPLPSFAEQTDETQAFTEPTTEDASSFADPWGGTPTPGPRPEAGQGSSAGARAQHLDGWGEENGMPGSGEAERGPVGGGNRGWGAHARGSIAGNSEGWGSLVAGGGGSTPNPDAAAGHNNGSTTHASATEFDPYTM